ncbi:uncharacterized protein EDB91DRAFT_1086469 [Suillus paluster]|uniref:uncharacterized protein n=1 Tax=Suillus paluster TaxID=48578 RepID=UPI001B85E04B|nr:uncharacterized protein EDB91DRAFT_1086469 [Suillus paluster]KAG1727266.1 hypothetical protein EDB91DRAFT_1086469 [Suillus paluster]
MHPKKKARHTSPKWSLNNLRTRKIADTAHEDTDGSRQQRELSTRGVGGHAAQLKKNWRDLSGPGKATGGKTYCQNKLGFKPPSTDKQDPWEAMQSISHSSKKAVGKSLECDARKDRRPWDLDEHDESEDDAKDDANEQDHNDQPSEDEDGLLHDMQEAQVNCMASYGDEDSNTHMDLDQGDFDSRVLDNNPTHHKATDTFDVLEHHQMKNGQHKAPSPTCLAHTHHPSKLSFYPTSWQAFLQEAKLEMWLQAVLSHPLPAHQDVVSLAQEVLDTILWTYHIKKLKLDNELKKIVIFIMKQLYSIFLKGNSMHKECVSEAVAKLLKTSKYLRLPDSSEIKGVLSGFCDSGTDKVPDLATDMCRADFNALQKSINKLMVVPKRQVEPEEMQKEWAKEGMIGGIHNDSDGAAGSKDINIII